MASPFRPAAHLLVQYACYHRDRRNIATHFLGIPLIVFAVCVLLARPAFNWGPWTLTPAWIVWALSTVWYLTRGEWLLGVAVSLANALLAWAAHGVAGGDTATWLAWGVGGFVVGWVIQFVGHWYEGRKPAFVDDLVGLLVGPLFVTAEALFALGLKADLARQIEAEAGPTVWRDLSRQSA